jgi:hypothetical protein
VATFANKIFNEDYRGRDDKYSDYQVIRQVLERDGEEVLREARLYTLDPIATFVEKAAAENIAIMPLGAGGPGANSIAIDPKGQEHLRDFLEREGLGLINDSNARDIIRGTGELKGYMPFKVGKDPMQFDGFEALGKAAEENLIGDGDWSIEETPLPDSEVTTLEDINFTPTGEEATKDTPGEDDAALGRNPIIANNEAVGGIDLTNRWFDLEVKRDDSGHVLPAVEQPMFNMEVNGLVPVTISITPVTNLPLLLGLNIPTSDNFDEIVEKMQARDIEETAYLN